MVLISYCRYFSVDIIGISLHRNAEHAIKKISTINKPQYIPNDIIDKTTKTGSTPINTWKRNIHGSLLLNFLSHFLQFTVLPSSIESKSKNENLY